MIPYFRRKIYSILRASEKYTKTDMVYLTRGGVWLTFGQGITSMASFLLAIGFAHFLSKDVYGQYKYILSIASIITTFSLTGIGAAVVQSTSVGFLGTLKKAYWVNIKWSIFMVVGSLIGAVYYLLNGNTEIGISLIIIAVISPLTKSFELYDAYLGGRREFRRSAVYNSIDDTISAISLFLTILISNNAVILVAVYFIVNMLTKAFFYFKISNEIPKDAPVDYSAFKYGKHLSLINIWINFSTQIDKIIVFHYLGAIELAIYSFSTAIPKQIRSFIGMLGPLAMPKLSGRSVSEIQKSVPKKFLTTLFILGPITIIYILSAPYIYKVFFPQYMDSVFYSQIYASFILLMGNLSEVALTAKKAVKEKYIISLSVSIFNTILMLIMIRYYGVLGVVLSIVITKYLAALLSFGLLKRLKDEPINNVTTIK